MSHKRQHVSRRQQHVSTSALFATQLFSNSNCSTRTNQLSARVQRGRSVVALLCRVRSFGPVGQTRQFSLQHMSFSIS